MDNFTIELSGDELNKVLDALGSMPYRDSAPVINTIINQAQAQAQQQPPQEAEAAPTEE